MCLEPLIEDIHESFQYVSMNCSSLLPFELTYPEVDEALGIARSGQHILDDKQPYEEPHVNRGWVFKDLAFPFSDVLDLGLVSVVQLVHSVQV